MLKTLVGLLLLTNLGLLVAHTGLLDSVIARSGSAAQREPDRLAQQIRVPQVTLLKADGSALDSASRAAATASAGQSAGKTPAAAAAASGQASGGAMAASAAAGALAASAPASAASALSAATASMAAVGQGSTSAGPQASVQGSPASALACVEAGPFDAVSIKGAERTLRQAGLAVGSWVALDADPSARFMIHMGRYASAEAMRRKQDEIKRLGLAAEELQGAPALQPGLSLGSFESQASADAALAALVKRGIHTAQVVALTQPLRHTRLRVPAADATLRQRLANLALPGGRPFTLCSERVAGLAATSLPPPAAAASALR